MAGYVVAAGDVDETPTAGDENTRVRLTIGPGQGCERLEQRVIRFAAGQSRRQDLGGQQGVLYVVSGKGLLHVDGRAEELAPVTGAYIAAGESFSVENPGPDELVVVLVTARPEHSVLPPGYRTIRWEDRPSLPATPNREFRFLVNEDVGCHDITQFVGVIPSGRAPMHSHAYDEVVYVLEGEGFLHLDDRKTPIAAGSCIHLPPLVEHCLENTTDDAMRVLGVFYPAGSPASKASEAPE
jgi:mannose-6-phosphate isomerase-like protein (cupin superfamily)